MTVNQLFDSLWLDYTTRLCPSAEKVHHLLQEDTPLINDHIALRTFKSDHLGIEALAKTFIALGYEMGGEYHFREKKLYARHYQHPDPSLPKVFISELLVEQLTLEAQQIIASLLEQSEELDIASGAFLYRGRPWSITIDDYKQLALESEYASWLAAHGYGANHFTVSVNQLNAFDEVSTVNAFLRQQGFAINQSGGDVKGSPEVCLEQSSTLADTVNVAFSDGVLSIPGGFYEFAKRYQQPDGQLYQGFVEASANKIFESTHRQR